MNIRQKRIAILKEVDRLLELRCADCNKSSGGVKAILCNCDASKRIREYGEQLNQLLNNRYWDKKINNIKKRQTLTLAEFVELLHYEVRMEDVAKALKVNRQRLSEWLNYYGLSRKALKSKEETDKVLKEYGDVLFIRSGFSYAAPRKTLEESK